MANVTILLSTRDGARFLPDQLLSFGQQDHAAWRLRWRDDGSQDGTRRLLEAFAASSPPGRAAPLADDGRRRGILESFLALLRAHLATEPAPDPSHLVAFADQDDVWLPEKLSRGVRALGAITPDRPALYCARQMLVDARLRTIGLSPELRRPPGFPASLAQNVATGCTVMLNGAAARLIARTEAPGRSLHDWWAYVLVSAAGGAVLFDDVPAVLYRQHEANAVGSARSSLRRGAGALRRGPAGFMSLFRAHVAALRAAEAELSPDARASLAAIEDALAGGVAARLAALRGLDLGRQTFGETLLFCCWFALG